jgi:hypothetical protein
VTEKLRPKVILLVVKMKFCMAKLKAYLPNEVRQIIQLSHTKLFLPRIKYTILSSNAIKPENQHDENAILVISIINKYCVIIHDKS